MLLAIDPGNIESGYVILDEYKVIDKGKVLNEDLMFKIAYDVIFKNIDQAVIERIASYGMATGQTVFDTCVWIGRFQQLLIENNVDVALVFRKDVKMNICGQTRAKDSNIIQALIDRFAPNTPNRGKGKKASPGYFYGFKADIWQAFALGVTWQDMREVKK